MEEIKLGVMLIHLTILSTTLLSIKDEINIGVMVIHLITLATTLLLVKEEINQGVMVIHLTIKMIYNTPSWKTIDR